MRGPPHIRQEVGVVQVILISLLLKLVAMTLEGGAKGAVE